MRDCLLQWYGEAMERLRSHNGDSMMILRHGERHRITDPFRHELAQLTDEGREECVQLGRMLRRRGLHVDHCLASPVRRCEETAELVLSGMKRNISVRSLKLLGHIGPFIDDEDIAETTFRLMHMRDICNGLLQGDPVPGFTDITSGLKPLMDDLHSTEWGDLTLVVTHDFFVASIAGSALKMSFQGDEWIRFLEPMLLLRHADGVSAWFRGREAMLP